MAVAGSNQDGLFFGDKNKVVRKKCANWRLLSDDFYSRPERGQQKRGIFYPGAVFSYGGKSSGDSQLRDRTLSKS